LGHLGHFHITGIDPLSARLMRRPPSAGMVRSLAEHPPFGFAEAVEGRNRELIDMLETAPTQEGVAA
jgi:hypothetical protein